MPARYSGAWLRSAQSDYYEDVERFTVNTAPDEGHGDKSDAPPPLMMDAPVLQGGGEITTDANWEELNASPPGIAIDNTPVKGHGTPEDSGHGYGGSTRPGASITELAGRRGDDKGAATRGTSSSTKYRFFNENFFGYFTRGFEPPPMAMQSSSPVFVRGLNGHPVNNGPEDRPTAWNVDGDGWKRGDYESSNVQREFHFPRRRHGEPKIVESDHVTIIGDAPPPDKPDTYASPFSSLQKFLPKRRRVSGTRRDPAPWDEDLLAQPNESYGLVSADGMVVN